MQKFKATSLMTLLCLAFFVAGCLPSEKTENSSGEPVLSVDVNACTIESTSYAASSSGYLNSIFVDSVGRVYRGGADNDLVGVGVWKLNRFDSSAWSEKDSVQVYNDQMIAMAEADDGSLIAVGNVMDATPAHRLSWIVRKSADSGSTWNTVDATASDHEVKHILKTSSGALLAGGNQLGSYVNGSASYGFSKAVIRRSSDNGDSWSQVELFGDGNVPQNAFVKLVEDSNGHLYYFVEATTDAGVALQHQTFVRKSVDDGASWTTVATLSDSTPLSAAADSFGQLFLGKIDTLNGNVWTIQKSSDGGSTWSTVDQPLNIPSGTPNVMEISPGGLIVVAGNYMPSSSSSKIVVRVSNDGGITWVNVDSYSGGSGESVASRAINFVGSSILIGGNVSNSTGSLPPFIRGYECF